MNDTNTTVAATEDDDDVKVKREYFSPSQLDAAVARVGALSTEYGDKVILSFDPNDDNGIPENYGLLIQPQSERTEAGNELQSIIVCAVPSFEFVSTLDEGKEFIQKAMITAFATKIANAVRNSDDGTYNFPRTPKEFFERKTRASDDLSTWDAMAKGLVDALKGMGLKKITAKILRNCLQNKAFAEAEYPKMEQAKWDLLLDFAADKAKKVNLDPAIFTKWKATRHTAKDVSEVNDIDFAKLDTMFADKVAA